VGRVLLVGGSANLEGLPSFIAAKVQTVVDRGNVWNNVATFDSYIPPIDFRTSMQYATAIGLALRGF
jgi:Tfp pilus assembly PilM family ATPase